MSSKESGHKKGAFNSTLEKESGHEKDAFNKSFKESGHEKGVFNSAQKCESTVETEYSNLPHNDECVNYEDKGRGLGGIGKVGGKPPIEQLTLKPEYLCNVLDEREMDSARGKWSYAVRTLQCRSKLMNLQSLTMLIVILLKYLK